MLSELYNMFMCFCFFSQLLSSNLRPSEDLGENEHILGFTLQDIKKEVKRASKLVFEMLSHILCQID